MIHDLWTLLQEIIIIIEFYSVAVVLKLITNKNIHKRNNTKQSTDNKKHSKYKYTYYQNTHTIFKTPPHSLTHTSQAGADKYLARPGREEVTATKLGVYSTYSPRSGRSRLYRVIHDLWTLLQEIIIIIIN